MKERILSDLELDTLRRNLQSLEFRLGYPAPWTMVDPDELSKEILGYVEIDNMARNIERMCGRYNPNITNSFFYKVENAIYWSLGIYCIIYILFTLF